MPVAKHEDMRRRSSTQSKKECECNSKDGCKQEARQTEKKPMTLRVSAFVNGLSVMTFRRKAGLFCLLLLLVHVLFASMILLGRKIKHQQGTALVPGGLFSYYAGNEEGQLREEIFALIDRVVGLGPQGQVFRPLLELIHDENGGNGDTFEVDFSDSSPVIFRGTSGVALASAFKYYLGEYANSSISWGRNGTGNNVHAFWHPSSSSGGGSTVPPPVTKKTTKKRPVQWHYYMNVCTASYSMVWWDFARWRQEIDWMAMSGINLVLAFTGQEAVLKKVFVDMYNVSLAGFDEFVSGPAFLAWNRMGNIRSWGGPLPLNFIEGQKELQLQILAAMRALGITPALSGFSGRVPREFVEKYPQAKVTMLPLWERFPENYSGVYMLEATDPMFLQVGSAITATTMKMYGSHKDKYHIYSMDTYNEMLPSSNDPAYLSKSSAAVYNSMKSADPKGIWLMQGWLFIRQWWGPEQMAGYLSNDAVPDDKMIILDLDAQWAPQYTKIREVSNKTTIWCLLHSYGGRRDLYGNITGIHENARLAFETLGPSAMVGTGITPEAIDMNYIVFDFMNDLGWDLNNGPVDIAGWVRDYSIKRYGALNNTEAAVSAWLEMLDSVYNSESRSNAWMVVRPNFFDYGEIWAYDRQFGTTMSSSQKNVKHLAHSIGLLLTSAGSDKIPSTLSYDIVDFTRQLLSLVFEAAGGVYKVAFKHGDVDSMTALGEAMLGIVLSLDRLLATNVNFLLGTWLEDAKHLASGAEEESLFTFNAKNQITLWGPDGQIADYASKPWAGLVQQFHYNRWSKFINMTTAAAMASPGAYFDATPFNEFDLEFGKKFCLDMATRFAAVPTDENVVELGWKFYNEYAPFTGEYYGFCENQDFVLSGETYSVELPGLPVGTLAYLCTTIPACQGFREGVLFVGGNLVHTTTTTSNSSVFMTCNFGDQGAENGTNLHA